MIYVIFKNIFKNHYIFVIFKVKIIKISISPNSTLWVFWIFYYFYIFYIVKFYRFKKGKIFSKIIKEFFVSPWLFKDKKNPKLIKKNIKKSR